MTTTEYRPTSVANMAAFVSSTVGRIGEVHDVDGVICVRSPIPVPNGFVNAAFVVDDAADRNRSVEVAKEFFGAAPSPFVIWVPEENRDLVHAVMSAGGELDHDPAPDMWIDASIVTTGGFEVREVEVDEDFVLCARLCEEAYGIDGMAWLMEHHHMVDAPGVTWMVAYDDGGPIGAGCGFIDGAVGGIYYVATPPAHRGRGVAADVTATLTNRLLGEGARSVVLQASSMGLPVYERLGFEVRGRLERYRFD